MVNKKKNKRKFEISGELTWIHVVIFLVLCLVFIRETRFAFGNSEMDDSTFDMGNVGSVLPAGMLNLVNDGVVGGEESGQENHASAGDVEESIVDEGENNDIVGGNIRGVKGVRHYTIFDQMSNFTWEDTMICDINDTNKCIIVMDRNMGATTTGVGTGAPASSYGYYYQWGNNYGFTSAYNRTGKKPYYSDDYSHNGYYGKSFITVTGSSYSERQGFDWWAQGHHNELWGGENDIGLNNIWDIDSIDYRQGPCPVGYHVPSAGERIKLYQYWYANVYGEATTGHDIDTSDYQNFIEYFNIPLAGYINNAGTLSFKSMVGKYWTSSPGGNGFSRSVYLDNAHGYLGSQWSNDHRANGYSVRCFLDVDNIFEKFNLSFESNGGSSISSQLITENEYGIKPENPEKNGYVFGGWFDNSELSGVEFNFQTPIIKDLVLYAKWNNLWNVYFETNGGSKIESQIVEDGNNCYEPSMPIKTGYVFGGWYEDESFEEMFDFNKKIMSDLTLYAGWIACPEGYAVVDNECIESKCGDINKQYVDGECRDMKRGTIVNNEGNYECIAEGAVYDNMLQQCVYRTDDFSIMSTNLGVTEDNELGLYYQWGKKYGFDRGYYGYIDEGGNNYNAPLNDVEYELFNSYDIEENMCYIRPDEEDPCPDGFHVPTTDEWNTLFISWCKNSDFCDEDLLVESEIPGCYSLGDPDFAGAYMDMVYQFIEDYNLPLAGSRDNDNIYMLGSMGDYWSSEYGVGAVPYYREGYLKSWGFAASLQGGLGPISFISNFGASVRCFSNFVVYTVTFESDGGNIVLVIDVEKGNKLVEPGLQPEKTGYIFVGWHESGVNEKFDFNQGITRNVNLEAAWAPIVYTITFDTDGGSLIHSITGYYGDSIVMPANPIKEGYQFAGWDKNIPTSMPADNIVIRAKWTKNETHSSNGGGTQLKRDNCPGGDYSNSYYDGDCGSNPKEENKQQHNSSEEVVYDTLVFNPHYSDEQNKAYQYAYHYGITTKTPICNANIDGNLTRIAMAKMLSQYAINVLGMKPDKNRNNQFKDVTDKLDGEYDDGVTLAYQLGIMGINMPNNEFRPNDLVPRAEFVTALSRLLYKTPDGIFEETPRYYVPHMEKLIYEGIINNPDPKMLELRGYVMIMLMRSAK